MLITVKAYKVKYRALQRGLHRNSSRVSLGAKSFQGEPLIIQGTLKETLLHCCIGFIHILSFGITLGFCFGMLVTLILSHPSGPKSINSTSKYSKACKHDK